jgi:pyridoxine/pyridoxamine 5'-phosphate oxidase
MPTNNIADLRKSYERAALNETESLADPRLQFEQWLQQAIDNSGAQRHDIGNRFVRLAPQHAGGAH